MVILEFPPEQWPTPLREIPHTPERLWIRGTMPAPNTRLLTVVGSRALTRYGQEACEKLILGLAGYPISIVSGLALGADACAHKAALRAGLHTIAIPGSGLADSVIAPRTNVGLAHEILEAGGALLSEQEPLHVPRKGEFPSRNRIMIGMSDAVLIIEAGEKSGTLITARLAGEYGRELLCVPHRIGDPHSFGSHLFLRIGGTLVSEPMHILEALKLTPREAIKTKDAPSDLEGVELVLWSMLIEPKTRDEILRHSSHTPGEVLTALVALELRGLIKEEFGAWRRV